ncbi:hypothetical protein UPYG_G00090430 [Umbra pygmaea]|uniref:THAP domain-containing protein 1 n=1 Tax=Umbra pygmaea TaxID=75934 RepID=A0ABD0XFN9_UMBPY
MHFPTHGQTAANLGKEWTEAFILISGHTMVGCTAFGCSNRSEKGYRMYGFPKDQERSKRWMAMGSRQNLPMTGASNSRKLCHVHFEDDQFTSTKTGGKLKLRPDAVPTLFIHRPKPKRRKPPFERAPPAPIQTTTDHTYYAKLNFGQPAYEMMETDPDTEITRTNTALSARRRKREKRKNTLQPAEGEDVQKHTACWKRTDLI